MNKVRIHTVTAFTLSLALIGFLAKAQKKNIELVKKDFALASPYYLDNLPLKKRIFEYLDALDNVEGSLDDLLADKCLSTERTAIHRSDSTDEIAQKLSTLGPLTFCITEVTETGGINYRTTHSGNLNIDVDKGTLTR